MLTGAGGARTVRLAPRGEGGTPRGRRAPRLRQTCPIIAETSAGDCYVIADLATYKLADLHKPLICLVPATGFEPVTP
jgi:hypothetical protein